MFLELAVFGFYFGGQHLVLLAFLLVEVEQDTINAEQDEHQGDPEEDAAVVGAGFGGFVRVHAGIVMQKKRMEIGAGGAVRHVPLGVKIGEFGALAS
ncbi:hypothetical protein GCM10022409_34440 [Hymenobacter glaciei]|uniref:Uncharacterized protein n=1 Tax=Hymenobacter glaciei TaxID=877209 RepID=A0ABP7UJX6_9BACT